MISNLGQPTSAFDVVTKSYVDNNMHSCIMNNCNGMWAPIHDPRFADIEHILSEVGIKCLQVVPYATEYIPYGTTPETAKCVVKNFLGGAKCILLVNINGSGRKRLWVCVDKIGLYTLPDIATSFDMHHPDFFLELARYLKMKNVLSFPEYGLVRLKLWWNK